MIPAALWKQPPLVCLWNMIRSSSSWPRSLKVFLLMRWRSLKKLCWINPAFLICFPIPRWQWTHNADLISQRQSPALGSMQTSISWSISHTVQSTAIPKPPYCFFLPWPPFPCSFQLLSLHRHSLKTLYILSPEITAPVPSPTTPDHKKLCEATKP